jgi:hypothetical protein
MRTTSTLSAPPLIAPGQWFLASGLPPVVWMRVAVYGLMAATIALAQAWGWSWLLAVQHGQTPWVSGLMAWVAAQVWTVLAARIVWRLRRPAPPLCLRWCPGERLAASVAAHWRVLNWGDRPVRPELVLSLLGWRLLRLSQPSPDPRVQRQAWCWVPPLASRHDPQDLHRLSCLLTLRMGQFDELASPVASSASMPVASMPVSSASSRHPSSSTPSADTQFADTVFADTVWMGEALLDRSPVLAASRAGGDVKDSQRRVA